MRATEDAAELEALRRRPQSASERAVCSLAVRLAARDWRGFVALLTSLLGSSHARSRIAGSMLLAAAPRGSPSRRRRVRGIAEDHVLDDNPIVAANALFALYCQGPTSRVPAPVFRALRSKDEWIVRNATYVLYSAQSRAPGVTRALERLTSHDSPTVRYWAAHGLANRARGDRRAVRALSRLASDSQRDVRGEAMRGLALGRHPDAAALVIAELDRPGFDPSVVEAAAALRSASVERALEAAADRRTTAAHVREEIGMVLWELRARADRRRHG